MDKFVNTMIGAVLIGLFVITSGPALADCKADIDKARKEAGDSCPMNAKGDKIVSLLDKAEKALASGDKAKCEKLVTKAKRKIGVNC